MSRPHDRIDAYDRARAIAIIGMIFVNLDKLISVLGLEPRWIDTVIEFITGRAAVLFVMLAGFGLVQSYGRTSPGKESVLRNRMIVRAVLLGILGGFLMNVWPADILHYYTAFILFGVRLLDQETSRLFRIFIVMIGISVPLCTLAAYHYEGGEFLEALHDLGLLSMMFDYLFLGGYYNLFPWACFFLLGMLAGRIETRIDRRHYLWVAAGCCLFTIAVESLVAVLDSDAVAGWFGDDESPLRRALTVSEAFPVTPLFFFSSAASCMTLLAMLRLLPEPRREPGCPAPLVVFGRMSLTFYIAHILIGTAYSHWIDERYGLATSGQALFFAIGFIVAGILFAMVWSRYFSRGPLEMVMNTMTHFFVKTVTPAMPYRAGPA
jgi:uncharacterized protein